MSSRTRNVNRTGCILTPPRVKRMSATSPRPSPPFINGGEGEDSLREWFAAILRFAQGLKACQVIAQGAALSASPGTTAIMYFPACMAGTLVCIDAVPAACDVNRSIGG